MSQTPNLTMDSLVSRNTTKGGVVCDRYKSLKELSQTRNIPIKLLRIASKEFAPGIKSNGIVHWEELQPWLSVNYARLDSAVIREQVDTGDAQSKWQLRKLKAEVIKLENHNKTKSKDYISRKAVIKTIQTLYGGVFARLNRYLEMEQPAKVEGMTAIQIKQHNHEFLIQLLTDLKNQETLWSNATDLTTEADAGEETISNEQ